MAHYTITAPVTGTDDKTRYPRVGVLFENHNRETGEVYFPILRVRATGFQPVCFS